eukprot:TRINITY_DN8956_c0_g1_i1.p1 TRINITY_DN8956_c0_g1~~TRINITY_DN8956_c0_g1_i1.p1  ORF type:complete len:238 (+),score=37.99 TRINITY_DN8956_c0_g1_i1:236-949(+)
MGLQLCLQVQLPLEDGGLHGGAVYITSEDVPTKRLQQMAHAFAVRHPRVFSGTSRTPMDSIYIERAETLAEQERCLSSRIPMLLRQTDVKLVVLDSVTSLFRAEFDNDEYLSRARAITEQARLLQGLCKEHGVVVVVTNQVTDVFDTERMAQSDVLSRGRAVRPALGFTWSHHLFQRIVLSRSHHANTVRELHIKFAPHVAPGRCEFNIDNSGIIDYVPTATSPTKDPATPGLCLRC